MSLQELETAVAKLPREDLNRFAAWFAEFQTEVWDRQIEEDSRSGRLDAVLDEVGH
jgi:hypothetical protein